jgi:hypothetical protein
LIKEDDFVSDSAKKKFRELKDQRNNQTRWTLSTADLLNELWNYLENLLSDKKPIEQINENTQIK